jgi:protein-S-isoprenylcysteine O-methyltransferase Ste14
VQEGPYRFVRHPFYAAYTLSWLAGWVASHSWLALGSTIIMVATYIVAASREERKFRTSALAAAHAAYCRRTGFMLPLASRLWRLDPDRAR